MPIAFQGAPYPSDPARLTVNNTFSGNAVFTSTARPTSAGTGTPDPNSLMTNDDVALAELHYRHAAKSRFISIVSPVAIFGSVRQGLNNNGASLSIIAANTYSAVSFGSTQIHNVFSGQNMSFARPFIASLYFVLRDVTSLNAIARFFVGAANSYLQNVDALSQAGICVEIGKNGSDIQARLVYFSDTFKTTAWVNLGVDSNFFTRTNTLVIRNNGSGKVDIFILVASSATLKPIPDLFASPTITVSDGPTTAPSASVLIQASIGATVTDTPSSNNEMLVQNFTLEFTN